ncbi:MAG: redoxin domain-containing protein [Bacteroidia bacterium]|nr:redoxin domain-containing protein [Bacteroidia bacterium]
MQPLRIGEIVPALQVEAYLPDTRQFASLSTQSVWERGHWLVLFFYPADFTFVCPTELADLGELYSSLQSRGVEVWAVSTDTIYAHLAWQTTEKLLSHIRYPMVADPTGQLSRLFGVYDEKTGLALRGTFILTPEGQLVGSEITHYDVGRSAAELLRKIEAYVYVRTHPGEVCPAKWQPGQKTLRPGANLVGQVAQALSTSPN